MVSEDKLGRQRQAAQLAMFCYSSGAKLGLNAEKLSSCADIEPQAPAAWYVGRCHG